MEMTCSDARPLVGAYLDGELSQTRSSLLRKHLLDCHACRTGAQDGKNLKRWFTAVREDQAQLSGAVPSGFAARVARRAFAGDVGHSSEQEFTLKPRGRDSETFDFVLRATAIAAGLALLLAVAARLRGREVGSTMSADDRAPVPVKQVVEELERLNSMSPGVPSDSSR